MDAVPIFELHPWSSCLVPFPIFCLSFFAFVTKSELSLSFHGRTHRFVDFLERGESWGVGGSNPKIILMFRYYPPHFQHVLPSESDGSWDFLEDACSKLV
ncbi:hypothetical protein Tco_1052793 [Tanacetum coccineum]